MCLDHELCLVDPSVGLDHLLRLVALAGHRIDLVEQRVHLIDLVGCALADFECGRGS